MSEVPDQGNVIPESPEKYQPWHEVLGKRYPEWYEAMWQALETHEFGSYCHEGRDLLTDAAKILGRTVTNEDEDIQIAQMLASDMVWHCEESICGFCQQETDEITDQNAETAQVASDYAYGTSVVVDPTTFGEVAANQSVTISHEDLLELALRYLHDEYFEQDAQEPISAREFRYLLAEDGIEISHTDALLILEEAENVSPNNTNVEILVREHFDFETYRFDRESFEAVVTARRLHITQHQIDWALENVNASIIVKHLVEY